MTNYTITENHEYNSREVYFDDKPATAVLDALKSLKMRWNHKKACWYGYATESELVNAILDNGTGETITGEETTATVYTDGYLGGGAVYGSKSRQYLYGAELSAAVRADLKAAGIKGASVRCKTYSGGQSFAITVTFQPEDLADPAEYLRNYRISPASGWINMEDAPIHVDRYFSATAEEQHAIRYAAAKYEYTKYATTQQSINHFYMDKYSEFSPAFLDKLNLILDIVKAYHYDESNGMVDYFHTNFYYDLYTNPINPTIPNFPGELSDLYTVGA